MQVPEPTAASRYFILLEPSLPLAKLEYGLHLYLARPSDSPRDILGLANTGRRFLRHDLRSKARPSGCTKLVARIWLQNHPQTKSPRMSRYRSFDSQFEFRSLDFPPSLWLR